MERSARRGSLGRAKVMATLALAAVVLATASLSARPDQGAATETIAGRVRKILAEVPLVDGHNDLAEQLRGRADDQLEKLDLAADTSRLDPPMNTDIPRLRRGGVGGQFFAAYVPVRFSGAPAVQYMFEQIDVIRRVVTRYQDVFGLAVRAADVERIHHEGKIAALIGVEGGHAIGDSLAMLRQAYDCGARYLTLTHWNDTDWADASTDTPRHHGLTPFGREVVREMNRLGMLVDLSHTSDDTIRDALAVSEAPVICSHSSARALCHHPRNVPDDLLRAIAAKGGIVMVNFSPGFVSEEVRLWEVPLQAEWTRLEKQFPNDRRRAHEALSSWKHAHPGPHATLVQVADHIDHIRAVAGIDHVGLGSDFDGIEATPEGLEDVSRYPALLAELLRRGYSDAEVEKVAGLNILRVMREAEAVAVRLQRTRQPSDATIEALDGTPTRATAAP
jgi:membrane dipeptidase